MELKNHILQNTTFKRSPNTGGVIKPTYLIIHYDTASNSTSAVNWMTDPSSKVSAHLHIDRSGNVVQLVPFYIEAWHAGISEWKGLKGLNKHSIGIELQNTGTQEYTQAQLDVLAEVSKAIVEAYPIKEILGHSDISPGRKIDPGKQFPMEWLRGQVFGGLRTTADLHLREGAGTDFKSIQVLPKGTEVNVLSESGGWSEVFVCDLKLHGWVSNKYITR